MSEMGRKAWEGAGVCGKALEAWEGCGKPSEGAGVEGVCSERAREGVGRRGKV